MSTNPDQVDWDYVYERNRRIWLGLDDAEVCSDDDENEHIREAKKENSMKNVPFLPKNLGTPKNVIPHWYERRNKGYHFKSNDCFFTWNDNGKPHEMRHTCIFKCPLTGELFGCGQFGDKSSYQVKKESTNGVSDNDEEDNKVAIVWHRKKKDAEHAAAARALDCLSYREGEGILSMCYGLCEEDPYLEDAETKFVVPSSIPPAFFEWLENSPSYSDPIAMHVDDDEEAVEPSVEPIVE